MPPILLIVIVTIVGLMMMFSDSPLDKWRKEREKYGKDPVERSINQYIEKNKNKMESGRYKPPSNAQIYNLPPEQAHISRSRKSEKFLGTEDNPIVPPTEMPALRKGETASGIVGQSIYPSYMMPSQGNEGINDIYVLPSPEINVEPLSDQPIPPANMTPKQRKQWQQQQTHEPFQPAGM